MVISKQAVLTHLLPCYEVFTLTSQANLTKTPWFFCLYLEQCRLLPVVVSRSAFSLFALSLSDRERSVSFLEVIAARHVKRYAKNACKCSERKTQLQTSEVLVIPDFDAVSSWICFSVKVILLLCVWALLWSCISDKLTFCSGCGDTWKKVTDVGSAPGTDILIWSFCSFRYTTEVDGLLLLSSCLTSSSAARNTSESSSC